MAEADWSVVYQSINDQKCVFDSQLMKITSVVNNFTLFIDDEKGRVFWVDEYDTGTLLGVNWKYTAVEYDIKNKLLQFV